MSLKDLFLYANQKGLPVPFAHDSVKQQPSITLFFLFVANTAAVASLFYLHVKADPLIASSVTCCYAVIWAVLYLIRNLQHAKVDLSDQSIELDGEDSDEKTN